MLGSSSQTFLFLFNPGGRHLNALSLLLLLDPVQINTYIVLTIHLHLDMASFR